MFCPVCGQQQVSEDTRFCSRCGFPLVGVTNIISNGGNLPFMPQGMPAPKPDTPRKKGVKKGLMIFLSTFLIVPLLMVLVISVHGGPFIPMLAAVLFGVGGLLRMAYALLLESNEPNGVTLEENVLQTAKNIRGNNAATNALPPQTSIPVSDYDPPKAGHWRDTNDFTHSSVVENTTRQLGKEDR